MDRKRVMWRGRDGRQYQVTPLRTVQSTSGRYCREYQAKSTINGRSQNTTGTACRNPDGTWQLVN